MNKNELIRKNPLRVIEKTKGYPLNGEFGGILARAGVGKTSFMVQLALDSLFQEINVLHISLNEPVKKICVWYEEIFDKIATQYQINIAEQNDLWEFILSNRYIMSFKADHFEAAILEDRLTELTEQNIFFPRMVLFDGLEFNDEIGDQLIILKELAKKYNLPIWFTIQTHRDDTPAKNGLPPQINKYADHFKVAYEIKPAAKVISIQQILGNDVSEQDVKLLLDPTTLLLKNI